MKKIFTASLVLGLMSGHSIAMNISTWSRYKGERGKAVSIKVANNVPIKDRKDLDQRMTLCNSRIQELFDKDTISEQDKQIFMERVKDIRGEFDCLQRHAVLKRERDELTNYLEQLNKENVTFLGLIHAANYSTNVLEMAEKHFDKLANFYEKTPACLRVDTNFFVEAGKRNDENLTNLNQILLSVKKEDSCARVGQLIADLERDLNDKAIQMAKVENKPSELNSTPIPTKATSSSVGVPSAGKSKKNTRRKKKGKALVTSNATAPVKKTVAETNSASASSKIASPTATSAPVTPEKEAPAPKPNTTSSPAATTPSPKKVVASSKVAPKSTAATTPDTVPPMVAAPNTKPAPTAAPTPVISVGVAPRVLPALPNVSVKQRRMSRQGNETKYYVPPNREAENQKTVSATKSAVALPPVALASALKPATATNSAPASSKIASPTATSAPVTPEKEAPAPKPNMKPAPTPASTVTTAKAPDAANQAPSPKVDTTQTRPCDITSNEVANKVEEKKVPAVAEDRSNEKQKRAMSVEGITESTKPSEDKKIFVTSDENIEKQSAIPQLKQQDNIVEKPVAQEAEQPERIEKQSAMPQLKQQDNIVEKPVAQEAEQPERNSTEIAPMRLDVPAHMVSEKRKMTSLSSPSVTVEYSGSIPQKQDFQLLPLNMGKKDVAQESEKNNKRPLRVYTTGSDNEELQIEDYGQSSFGSDTFGPGEDKKQKETAWVWDPTKTEKRPTVVDPRYLLSRLLFNYAE